jgi:hypothetical protein
MSGMTEYRPNRGLEAMRVLVGEWEFGSPQFPGGRGRAVFEWLDGGAFLVQRSWAPDPAPDSTWIFGVDEREDGQTVLYYDQRGVSRVYRGSLSEGTWRLWRDAPGFWQRFTGRIAGDGRTIGGAWESSRDGVSWEHDFDLAYTRVRGG